MARRASRSVSAKAAAIGTALQQSRLRQFGVGLLCAKVAVVPLVFDFSLDWPFTVAKALVSHGLAYVLAGVIAALAIRFRKDFLRWSSLHIPVLAFLVANIAATAFAADRLVALYGAHARMLGLGTIADWVVLYFAVFLLVRTHAEAVAVIACAFGASIVVLGYELVQLLGRDPLSWNLDVVSRPISTIGQATSLAQYLTVLALAAVGLALFTSDMSRTVRTVMLVLAAMLLVGAGATGTRSAILGIVAGSAFMVLATWLRHPSRRARMLALSGAGFASAALAALLVLTPLGGRIAAAAGAPPAGADSDLLARLEPTTETRVAIYRIALAAVQERPLLGYGPDNFVSAVPRFRTETEPNEIRQSLATSAHSWIAYAATSGGLLGLAAFVAIAAVALGLALRDGFRPAALVGAAMVIAFLGTGVTTINDISTDWLFWAAVGMVAVATVPSPSSIDAPGSMRISRSEKNSRRVGDAPLRPAQVLCVALALALSVTAINAWEAARSNRSSQESRLEGRTSQ
jgi:O-antigen ligase